MSPGQGCWENFRAETFSRVIQMASKGLLSPSHMLHSNAIKYKIPPSKALEAFLTGGTDSILFQAADVLRSLKFVSELLVGNGFRPFPPLRDFVPGVDRRRLKYLALCCFGRWL